MRHGSTFFTLVLLVVGVFNFSSCSTRVGAKVSSVQYPLLNHTEGQEGIGWHLYNGPDFQVFYGQSKNSESAKIGIYLGGYPDFHPDEKAEIVNDKLGIFSVKWYETVRESSPRFCRDALIEYKTSITKGGGREWRHTEKIHIWAYGSTRAEMLAMTDYAGGLKLFAEKPPNELQQVE